VADVELPGSTPAPVLLVKEGAPQVSPTWNSIVTAASGVLAGLALAGTCSSASSGG